MLIGLLLEDIVMDNNPFAKELFYAWQPKATADAALAMARAMTPCRLLMPGGAS